MDAVGANFSLLPGAFADWADIVTLICDKIYYLSHKKILRSLSTFARNQEGWLYCITYYR
jgi:hypothetical protein